MNKKIKSLIRKILGRPTSVVTIDTVSKIPSGLCIIGWYRTAVFEQFLVEDKDGKSLPFESSVIPRDDVVESIGENASGFQLLVDAAKDTEVNLFVVDKAAQKTHIPLEAGELPRQSLLASFSSSGQINAYCDSVIVADDYCFATGWIIEDGKLDALQLLNGNDEVFASNAKILRFGRKDVTDTFGASAGNAGFIALFERNKGVKSHSGVTLEVTTTSSIEKVQNNKLVFSGTERSLNLKRVLNNWHASSPMHFHNYDVVLPMVKSIYPESMTTTSQRINFGELVDNPKATLVIPLYGRYDFLRYQVSHFNRTQDASGCEIIYVVDDPRIHQATSALANQVFTVTGQPFSVVLLAQNVGYGKANNIGVTHANSENVILLNSDIIPKTAGWIDLMLDTLTKNQSIGAVGARLLFEDNSLQHDGMAPVKLPEYSEIYVNDHPFKGWPVSLSPYPAGESECKLITAACLAIKKNVFEEVGGFSPEYVLGDFEDSDLCLKLNKAGYTNYIRRDAELYHLERQSQNLVESGRWKHNLTILNAISFNQKWKPELDKIAAAGGEQ